LGSRDEQAVVGPYVSPALDITKRHWSTHAADAGVDDREMDAGRHVLERRRENERTLEHLVRLDSVRDVDDLDVGRDPLHHPVAGADEVVFEAEVGQEGDEHAASLTAARSPSRSCVSASATTRSPARSAARVVCGPIDTAGTSTP